MEILYANDIEPYMFEPNPGENYTQSYNSESDSSISDSSEDEEFEAIRLRQCWLREPAVSARNNNFFCQSRIAVQVAFQ